MRTRTMTSVCGTLIAMAIGASSVWAAREQAAETPLTEAGQKLLDRYAGMLTELQAEISKSVPTVDEQKKSAYLQAHEAEKAAEAEVNGAQQNLGKVATALALVNHAKGKWIGGADKGIAESQVKLKNATTDAERQAAQEELVKWQKNREDGVNALNERQAVLDQAKRDEPRLIHELEAAQKALARAQAKTLKTVDALDLKPFLSSNLGGKQLHYNRTGEPEDFEYTFDAPAAGKYALTARVVTPSWKQHLLLTVNDAKAPIDIALPHTVGMWDETAPVEVTLVKGRNVLRFSRNEPVKGLTIKEFTLTPVK